jgi:polysaccharide export outer membrane protein
MPCRFDFPRHDLTARRIRRGRWVASFLPVGRLVFFATAALLSGCRTANYTAANLPAELRASPAPESRGINVEQMAGAGAGTSQIGPGDLVEITIVSGSGTERPVPMPARVTRDGTVMVPLVGGVQVGGLDPVVAEQRIAAAAIERGIYRQPYVTITVSEPAVNRVTVLGAVEKPGLVKLPRGSCDLASALAAAGGLSKDASTRVEIMHRSSAPFLAEQSMKTKEDSADVRLAAYVDPVKPASGPFGPPAVIDAAGQATHITSGQISSGVARIDLAQVGASASQNQMLDDGDIVMVMSEETQVIHVTGLVKKPDQFQLARDKDLRVLDAIAMAGGISSPVADKVFVIRQLPNMQQPAVIKVSIARSKRHGDENLLLQAGDLVSVESTAATMTVDAVSRFFRIAIGGSLTAF